MYAMKIMDFIYYRCLNDKKCQDGTSKKEKSSDWDTDLDLNAEKYDSVERLYAILDRHCWRSTGRR